MPLSKEGTETLAWHSQTDVVVIGSGAAGLPAAIVAREAGSSVIVVEAEQDPAKAHPLTYASLGFNNLMRLAQQAGLL